MELDFDGLADIGSDFDGLYITGGKVEAKGGANAPGIGTSIGYRNDYKLKNVQISGGDTVVIAIGDKSTNMPVDRSGRRE